jgi:natural product biosynthesis luciferase-like monooxygenase protein
MSVHELIGELRERNVRLWTKDGQLCFSAPRDALDADTKRRMADHKSALVELLLSIHAEPDNAEAAAPPVDPEALSFAQERLLFLHQMDADSAAYHIPSVLRVKGPLDAARLEGALRIVIRRHGALRSRFVFDGTAFACATADEAPFELAMRSLPAIDEAGHETELNRIADELASEPFDLERAPLLRATLVAIGPEDHALVLVIHHLVCDGWSLDIIGRDLWRAYEQLSSGPQEALAGVPAYGDFVASQRAWLESADYERQKSFWLAQLADLPMFIELPADKPRPPVQRFEGAVEHFEIPARIINGLEQLGRGSGTSLYMQLAGALFALLNKYSGERDIAIGTPVANRALQQWEEIVGFFSNVVVLRHRLDPEKSCRELLAAVRDTCLSAYEHQAFPFEKVVEHLQPQRSLSYSPLFQVMFILKEASRAHQPCGLEVETLPPHSRISKFDLTLTVQKTDSGAIAGFEYSTALFEAPTVRRMAEHYLRLLDQILERPDRKVGEIDLVGPDAYGEMTRLWNGSEIPFDSAALVHELVEAQVLRTPDAVAASFGDEQITYQALLQRADMLAQALAAARVGPESRVGVYVDRSLELLVALLGILKAGGAYVPLDPSYPAGRIAAICEDAGLQCIVTRSDLCAAVPATDLPVLSLDALGDQRSACIAASAENLAYVIYTSGSTGRPKGVMVSHRNVVNLFDGLDRSLAPALSREAGRPVWMALTSISFDISVLELLWTLARGHKIVLQKDHLTVISAPAAGKGARPALRGAGRRPTAVRDRRAPDFSLFYFASDEGAQADKYRLLLEGARFADANGFSALWVPERHFHAFGGQFPNPSVAAAAIAAITSRIEIRAGSVVLPLHDPIRIAEEWSMVDNLSGGRAAIAFASGWHFNDFVLAPGNFERRHEVMREGIETVRRLWSGGSIRRIDGLGNEVEVGIRPKPVQPALPVWITSAASPETFRYAGEIGANVLTHLLGQSLAELQEKIGIYRAARRDHGHDPDAGRVTLMLHTFVGADQDAVREAVREPFKNYLRTSINLLRPVAESQGLDAGSDLELVVEAGFNRYFGTSALFGTPETCLALVEDVSRIGVDEIACLIDFGVDPELVVSSMADLGRLREATAAWAKSDALPEGAGQEAASCTHIQCTPSFAKLLIERPESRPVLEGIRAFLVGGEALPAKLAREIKGGIGGELFNMYGPTETTVWSAVRQVLEDETVIGAPISNTQLHVLDARGLPVPIGAKGELHIGGEGVTRGYRGRPELTAERFVPDRFAGQPGKRLYRTGDLVRRREDGTIEFLGRLDGQVKVRGFRVELGEIEAVLHGHPGVDQVVAVVRSREPGDAAISAYVTAKEGAGLPIPELFDRLRSSLPDYMVPSAIVELPALPLTPNGKVDRAALPAPNAVRAASGTRELPRNEVEAQLSEVWCEILKIESVGINENFFELGGHSLLLGELRLKLAERFDREIGIIELFRYPTIGSLARLFAESGEPPKRTRRTAERSSSKQAAVQRIREQMKLRKRHG